MAVVWTILALAALGYLGLCLFYYFLQERFIFVRFRMARGSRFGSSSPTRNAGSPAPMAPACTPSTSPAASPAA